MKKRIKFILLIFLPLLIISLLFIKNVSADSGFDTDYDSGGFSSGSDWGSDYSSHSSSDRRTYWSNSNHSSDSSSNLSAKEQFILFWIFVIAILFLCGVYKLVDWIADQFERKRINGLRNNRISFERISQEEVDKVIPKFDIEKFESKSFEIFEDIQNAWMNFEYDNLERLLTDELYNTYVMGLEILKQKNQKNVMFGFENIETKLIGLNQENNQFVATILLNTKFYDYIEHNKGMIIRGNNTRKVNNVYLLTFVKSVGNNKNNICPNCGSNIEGNTASICKYCKSKIIFDSYDWVMSKKQKIN